MAQQEVMLRDKLWRVHTQTKTVMRPLLYIPSSRGN